MIANQVDHITPKANGGTDNAENLEAICEPCHKAKTARDNGKEYKPKHTTAIDGWPV
jgi:5-methylcytosine-specific restriction protein A